MNHSTMLHAADADVTFEIADEPTYTALRVSLDEAGATTHTVTAFLSWDQLAALCRVLMRNVNVASRVLDVGDAARAEAPTSRPDGPGAMLADIYRDGGRLTDHVAFGTKRSRGE